MLQKSEKDLIQQDFRCNNTLEFTEFDHPDEMDRDMLEILDFVRASAEMPIYITSDYREGDSGDHGTGEGVDISDNQHGNDISSRWRWKVLAAAYAFDIARIGIYEKHIHLGISARLDQKVAWIGKSQ